MQCNPNKKFINESYFLHDKSYLIKKTIITAINKQLSLYGSFSYFWGKTSISNLKLLTWSDLLRFLVEKKIFKVKLRLQLAQIDGSEVKTSDKKNSPFFNNKTRKKKKKRFVWANRNDNNKSTIRFWCCWCNKFNTNWR